MGKILLLGYFGAGNLGDDALLVDWLKRWKSQLQTAKATCDVCSSGKPIMAGFTESAELQGFIGKPLARAALLNVNPRQYDSLVMPGGSVLQNATSTRSLMYYLWVIWRFASAGIPVYMLGQGLGPLRGNMANNLSALVLSRVHLLALRDQRSYDWAKVSLGTPGREGVVLGADPVLRGTLMARADGVECKESDSVGMVVIPKRVDGTEEAMAHVRALNRLMGEVAASLGLEATTQLFSDDDWIFQEEAEHGLGISPEDLVDQSKQLKSAVLWEISSAALVVSYRLHGVVLAAAYGVPGLGVAYDPKVSAFCEEMGLPHCTPQEVIEGRAIELLRELWHNREQVKSKMLERREIALQRREAAEARFGEMMWGSQ